VKRLALITAILGSALALVPMASAAVLIDGGSTGSVGAVAPAIDPAIQAVLLRSQYGTANAVTLKTDVLGGNGTAATTSVSSGDSINWSNALAVTLAGTLLLAIAATVMTRRRHQPIF
jgi:hypothetical protein